MESDLFKAEAAREGLERAIRSAFTDAGLVVDRTHAKGDVAVRASASDLDLLVSGRMEWEALEVFGDGALLDRLVALDQT